MEKPFSRKNSPFHRMAVRIPLKPIDHVVFETSVGKFIRILNISFSGVGLYPESLEALEGDVLKGKLVFDKKKFSVSLRVVHRHPEIIGCHLLDPVPEVRDAINAFFENGLKALKLSRAEKFSGDQGEEVEKTTLYRGNNNCEFVVIEKSDQLRSFSIFLFGNYLEYDLGGGLTVAQSFESGPVKKGVYLVKIIEKPTVDVIDVAIKFTKRIEGLSASVQESVFKILEKARDRR